MTHISAEERSLINEGIRKNMSVSDIADAIGRDRVTVSRELKRNRTSVGCPSDDGRQCPKLERPPYVCNACEDFNKRDCPFQKWLYLSNKAQDKYLDRLVDSRTGVNLSEEELERINSIISPGTGKGQSVHHVITAHADEMNICEKTVYSLINKGFLDVKRHHLPVAPYRKQRKLKVRNSKPNQHKVDRKCLEGRRYEDFEIFMADHPDMHAVEIDTVLGCRGGKVLLTMNFDCCGLMLAFIRDSNDARSVKDVFDMLESNVGHEMFRKLFPVVLADNGSEFSDPEGIEFGIDKRQRTRLFYCHPYSAFEKPHVENNHLNIRKVLPKGTSFNSLTQEKVNLMMSHVNSLFRKEYGNCTAMAKFIKMYGSKLLPKLGIREIPSDEVCLKPELLKM